MWSSFLIVKKKTGWLFHFLGTQQRRLSSIRTSCVLLRTCDRCFFIMFTRLALLKMISKPSASSKAMKGRRRCLIPSGSITVRSISVRIEYEVFKFCDWEVSIITDKLPQQCRRILLYLDCVRHVENLLGKPMTERTRNL